MDVDFNVREIQERVREAYDIGYIGLYVAEDHKRLYIQSAHKRTRMTPKKVGIICARFGDIASVTTFSHIEGMLIEEIGSFRTVGKRSAPAAKGVATTGATTNNNNIDNSTTNNNIDTSTNNTTNNIDNSVTNNTIHLHVHAFGQEDVSGITLEAFKELMSNKEDILTSMKATLPGLCEYIVSREWERVKQRLHVKYLKDRKASETGVAEESESDSDQDLGEGGIFIPKEFSIGGELATFEKVENDKAYAEELRQVVEEITLLQEEAKYRSLGTPPEMAELLYEDPQNCNIMATTKDGNMSYYDGKRWQKVRVDNMTEVIENWQKKFAECVEMLEQREGEAMTKSFQGQYSEEIISNFEKDLVIEPKTFKRLKAVRKKAALLCFENVNARFKEVREATGKKVKRGSESDGGAKKQKYLKAATWAKLAAM